VCPSCGNLRSECSDPNIDWHPRSTVCWNTATQGWAWGQIHERYKNHPKDVLNPVPGAMLWLAQSEPPEGEDFTDLDAD